MHVVWKFSANVEKLSYLFLFMIGWNADLVDEAGAALFHPKVEAMSLKRTKAI